MTLEGLLAKKSKIYCVKLPGYSFILIFFYFCRNYNHIIMKQVATNENFAGIIASGEPVLVDFWASWCGPCRMISPYVDEIAEEYDGKATVVKCNVDDCEDIAAEFGIRNIPTLLFFKGGQVVDRLVGAVPKKQMTDKLDAIL